MFIVSTRLEAYSPRGVRPVSLASFECDFKSQSSSTCDARSTQGEHSSMRERRPAVCHHRRAPNEHPHRSRCPCPKPFTNWNPPRPPKLYHPSPPPTTTRSPASYSTTSTACVSSSLSSAS